MIPKIIHYCWFGGKPLPEKAIICINSWKKYLPDYRIIEWNESNFDINSNKYVKEAYEKHKWAFVTDYVRLYALYTVGGIYMDTDVEVIKTFDSFLKLKGFSGFERIDAVPTGIMASVKNHKFIKELLFEYCDLHFINDDGTLDQTTNVVRITNAAVAHGLKLDNTMQEIQGFVFFPKDYFCPKNPRTLEIEITNNTVTIHHFEGSWIEENNFRRNLKKILPVGLNKIIVKTMDLLHIK